jgi:hypothetical protein
MNIKEFNKEESPRVGIVAIYYGEPGSGKSFNAFAFPGPMLIIDTENRCELVLRQQEEDKEVYIAPAKTFKEVVEALNFFHTKTKDIEKSTTILGKGTIVIDSATMLYQFAQTEYLQTSGAQKIYPQFEWGKVYALLDNLIMKLRDCGHNVIFTSQVRDEYVEESKTGRRIMDIYKKLPYMSDIIIHCSRDSEKNERKFVVVKNGYGEEQYYEVQAGLEGLYSTLQITDQKEDED